MLLMINLNDAWRVDHSETLPGANDEAAPGSGVTADKCGESLARMTMLQCYSVPPMLS